MRDIQLNKCLKTLRGSKNKKVEVRGKKRQNNQNFAERKKTKQFFVSDVKLKEERKRIEKEKKSETSNKVKKIKL